MKSHIFKLFISFFVILLLSHPASAMLSLIDPAILSAPDCRVRQPRLFERDVAASFSELNMCEADDAGFGSDFGLYMSMDSINYVSSDPFDTNCSTPVNGFSPLGHWCASESSIGATSSMSTDSPGLRRFKEKRAKPDFVVPDDVPLDGYFNFTVECFTTLEKPFVYCAGKPTENQPPVELCALELAEALDVIQLTRQPSIRSREERKPFFAYETVKKSLNHLLSGFRKVRQHSPRWVVGATNISVVWGCY